VLHAETILDKAGETAGAAMSQKEAQRVEFEITSSQSIYMLACEKAGVVPKKRIRAALGRSSELR